MVATHLAVDSQQAVDLSHSSGLCAAVHRHLVQNSIKYHGIRFCQTPKNQNWRLFNSTYFEKICGGWSNLNSSLRCTVSKPLKHLPEQKKWGLSFTLTAVPLNNPPNLNYITMAIKLPTKSCSSATTRLLWAAQVMKHTEIIPLLHMGRWSWSEAKQHPVCP